MCSAAELCPTVCDPVDCSPPGSSVHGMLQARILEWVAISSSRGSSQASILCLLHWQVDSLPLSYLGNYTLKQKLKIKIKNLKKVILKASQVTPWQRICLPMQETWVQSLGGEDPLQKEMATRSRILAWRIPWTEEPGGLQYTGSRRVGHNSATGQQREGYSNEKKKAVL